jgi:uncharacterized protein (TIGR00369 family)
VTISAISVELGDLDRKMGIEILEESVERLVGTMPVAGNTQVYGRLHGGASMVLGEFLGSWAAALHAAALGKTAVGVDISGTHHRGVRGGIVTGVATPLHLGRRMATHHVAISDDQGRAVATVRITNALIDPEER